MSIIVLFLSLFLVTEQVCVLLFCCVFAFALVYHSRDEFQQGSRSCGITRPLSKEMLSVSDAVVSLMSDTVPGTYEAASKYISSN